MRDPMPIQAFNCAWIVVRNGSTCTIVIPSIDIRVISNISVLPSADSKSVEYAHAASWAFAREDGSCEHVPEMKSVHARLDNSWVWITAPITAFN